MTVFEPSKFQHIFCGTMFNDNKKEYTMALDQNEEKLIEKLVEALNLLRADKQDILTIAETKTIDEDFLARAGKIFDNTEACDVCRHAFHSWRNILDDWIRWKKENKDSKARVVKMRKKSP